MCPADTFITHQLKEKLDVVDALHHTNLLKHAGLDAQFQQGKACPRVRSQAWQLAGSMAPGTNFGAQGTPRGAAFLSADSCSLLLCMAVVLQVERHRPR